MSLLLSLKFYLAHGDVVFKFSVINMQIMSGWTHLVFHTFNLHYISIDGDELFQKLRITQH